MSTTKQEALIISSLIIFKAKLADFGIQEIISTLAIMASWGLEFLFLRVVKQSKQSVRRIVKILGLKFYCREKDVKKIKRDKTMRDKDTKQILMYDLFLD